MESAKGTWKGHDPRRLYYQLLDSNDSPSSSSIAVIPNFHGVLVLRDSPTQEIPENFAAEYVVLPLSARLFIFFQDKINGHQATTWVKDFAASKGLRLKLKPQFANTYHILLVIGEDVEVTTANLLALAPISSKGHYASMSPFDPDLDLKQPRGLKQLVHITLSSPLNWEERGLQLIVADIGHCLRHQKEKKANAFSTRCWWKLNSTISFHQLTSRSLSTSVRPLPILTDYIGLALCWFTCLSIHHANAHYPAKPPMVSNNIAPLPTSIAKELFLKEVSALTEGPQPGPTTSFFYFAGSSHGSTFSYAARSATGTIETNTY